MSAADTAMPAALVDPNRVGPHGDEVTGHGATGPASKRLIVAYGFWLFLLSDIVVFSAFFATYAVLRNSTADGPGPRQLFDLTTVGVETGCLLASSFVCGLASIAASVRSMLWTQVGLLITGLLGFAFVALEVREFVHMVAEGAGPSRSAFLTAFFSLVGLHGLHVSVGLLWLGTMMAQIWAKGFRANIMRRLLCYTLFWHALDIVWVGVFTIVYLIGVG
jgi:heme/copper-type cytochrome/quinol oxidase subunit 3